MKIFSPRSRADWKTFIVSAQPLRAPHWIVDVTRPQNGCGGCKRYPMNSRTPQQATWRTSDGSPWWLRSTKYNQPSGDYKANCFMDLWKPPTSENTVKFADSNCWFHSRSYYCQPRMRIRRKRKVVRRVKRAPFRRLAPRSQLKYGILQEVFYFKQGKKVPNLKRHSPDKVSVFAKRGGLRYVTRGKANKAWRGFIRSDNFACRWSGFLIIRRGGTYGFSVTS